ncbi:hypothetical protein OQA88_12955 [Cercophora sp. LCS_1]
MAEVEEQPQFTTLAERIAALNKQKNFSQPPPTAGKRPPPPPPPVRTVTEPVVSNVSPQKSPAVPPRPARSLADNAPPPLPRRTTDEATGKRSMAPPPVHPRGPVPPLPSRRPSSQFDAARRDSSSSEVSAMSNLSLNDSTSSRRLPPTLDQAKLPPLPPTRRELEAAKKVAEEEMAARSPALPARPSRIADPPVPSLPPRLPSRPTKHAQIEEPSPALPARRLPPPPTNGYKSALESGFSSLRKPSHNTPPPIPLASRPSAAQISALASRAPPPIPPQSQSQSDCLICQDFTAPDLIASRHPVSSLPRHNTVSYLASVLCSAFPSPTDKARAIFTWCHHNIAYDCEAFFGNNVCHVTPEDAIFSGKAVCAGYAGVFEAIARAAGLDCVTVSGHGKGFGYKPIGPNDPIPEMETSHAWNAVRIDGGQWKLVDSCWGAGNVSHDGKYTKDFKPIQFVRSNIDFGMTHFPEDSRHFYREDGRRPSWEEYITGPCREEGEPAAFFGRASEEGMNEFTFTPRGKRISVYSGEVVKFRFGKLCPHWSGEKNGPGKPMVVVLGIQGLDGRKLDYVPLDFDGFWWSLDVPARDLGAPGQTIMLAGVDTLNGQNARGVTKDEYLRKKGRSAMSFCGFAKWDLV